MRSALFVLQHEDRGIVFFVVVIVDIETHADSGEILRGPKNNVEQLSTCADRFEAQDVAIEVFRIVVKGRILAAIQEPESKAIAAEMRFACNLDFELDLPVV